MVPKELKWLSTDNPGRRDISADRRSEIQAVLEKDALFVFGTRMGYRQGGSQVNRMGELPETNEEIGIVRSVTKP